MGSKPNPKAGGTQFNQDVASQAGTDKQEVAEQSQDPVVKVDAAPAELPVAQGVTIVTEVKDVVVEEQAAPEVQAAPVIQTAADPLIPAVVAMPVPLPVAPQVTIAPTVVAAAPEVKVESTPIVVNTIAPVDSQQNLKDQIAYILRDVPAAYHTDISRVFVYLDRMAPNRPISNEAGAKEQVALYRAIQNIINRQEVYFTQLFTALLAIFKSEFKGALGDRYRLRFMESVVLGEGDRKGFNYLTHLLCVGADPVSRKKALESINFDRTLSNGVTAVGRDRILGYFDA